MTGVNRSLITNNNTNNSDEINTNNKTISNMAYLYS